MRGASWSELEQAGVRGGNWSKLGVRVASLSISEVVSALKSPSHVVGTLKSKCQYQLGPTCAQCFGSEGSNLGVKGGRFVPREVVGTSKLSSTRNLGPNKK